MTQKKIDELRDELLDFSIDIDPPKNIDDVILIIKDYSPHNNSKPFSFAFSLSNYLKDNNKLPPKCWIGEIQEKDIKEINNEKPKYHSPYKEFDYKNKKYFPYSVNLESYTINNESIKKLCNHLYQHIKQ